MRSPIRSTVLACSPLLVALGLAGCAEPVPLTDIVVEGGTAAQREVVYAELAAFDEAIGPGRLQLKSVRFGGLNEEKLNGLADRYRIRLASNVSLTTIARTVRHELCHTLDYQESISQANEALLESLRLGLMAEDLATHLRKSDLARRREAFAEFCELGPRTAELFSSGCPGEEADASELFSILHSDVWVESQPFPAAALGEEILNRSAPPGYSGVSEEVDVWPSDPGILTIEYPLVEPAGWMTSTHVDLYTGEDVVPIDASSAPWVLWNAGPALAAERLDGDAVGLGRSDGPGIAIAYAEPARDHVQFRTLVWTGDGWAMPDDACGTHSVYDGWFFADDRVWRYGADESGVWWSLFAE